MKRQKEMAVALVIFVVCVIFTSPIFAVEKKDKDAILEEIGEFLETKPEILRNAIFSIGDEYLRANQVDKAIALYEKALKALPDSEDFLNRLGGLYNQKGDYSKAAQTYKRLTEIQPENVWYLNMLSDAYLNAKENEKAASLWEDLTKKSKNAEVFMQAANFYSRENNLEKAISAIKKAIELVPENMGYLQNLESFYLRVEKFSEAEEICNKILEGSKEQWANDWANSELINIYQRQDKLVDLAVRFEKELAQSPKDLSQYRKLVELYQRQNERDKAIEVYEKAVSAGIEDRDINFRLLDLYEWAEKFDKAEAQIKKIIAASPQDIYLYERLGNLLGRAKKLEEAKKVWQGFLEKVPNDAGAFSRFGDRLNEWGDVNGAIVQYKKAQSLDLNNLWYSIRIADLLISQESFEEAKQALNNIVSKTTDDWMKREAERRINEINSRIGSKTETPASTVTETALPGSPAETTVVSPVEVPKVEKPKAEKVQEVIPEKKRKRGLFGR